MKLKTEFDISDYVFIVSSVHCKHSVFGPYKVGQVSATLTDSPGRRDDEIFENYKPQNKYEEMYMCVETGIRSGQVYSPDRMFYSYEDADVKATELNEDTK